MEALGLIEVNGYLAGIVVADAALKAANVELLNTEKIKGGLTTVELKGDVGAIQAAVEAGTYEAEKLGALISSHVIPRMDDAVQEMLLADFSTKSEDSAQVTEVIETPNVQSKVIISEEPSALTSVEEVVIVENIISPVTEEVEKKVTPKKQPSKKKSKDKK